MIFVSGNENVCEKIHRTLESADGNNYYRWFHNIILCENTTRISARVASDVARCAKTGVGARTADSSQGQTLNYFQRQNAPPRATAPPLRRRLRTAYTPNKHNNYIIIIIICVRRTIRSRKKLLCKKQKINLLIPTRPNGAQQRSVLTTG